MNELKRLAYLQAMGTEIYVSRCQLPGAAVTRRLAIVKSSSAAESKTLAAERASAPAPAPSALSELVATTDPARSATAVRMAAGKTSNLQAADAPPRFSLAAIACGGWLWLEQLDSAPIAAAQVQLLQAMSVALGLAGTGSAGPTDTGLDVSRFDWPIHTNRQLDLGPDAARSSAAGFIRRKLEQLDCRGLVLLGSGCDAWVAVEQLDCERLTRTVSTAAMLRDPMLKKQAWRDLQPFLQSA
jgi:hypothetical protein